MKLYAFHPKGHGPKSFFVMAENESDARRAVTHHIIDADLMGYDSQGWHTGDYDLTVLGANEVVVNDND